MEEVVIDAEPLNASLARDAERVARRDGWQTMFLETFRNSGNVRAACMYADVTRSKVDNAYKNDEAFSVEYDIAQNEAVDLLVAEAWNRARNGSDRLLEFLLKSHRKEVYAEKVAELAVGVKIDIGGQKPTDALLAKISQMGDRLPAAVLPELTDSEGLLSDSVVSVDG